MNENKTENVRRAYVPPALSSFHLSDGGPRLLGASTGQFEDMEQGGDLGGDGGNDGQFEDMGWGGSLGGDSGNNGSFSDMGWGSDLGGTVTGN